MSKEERRDYRRQENERKRIVKEAASHKRTQKAADYQAEQEELVRQYNGK